MLRVVQVGSRAQDLEPGGSLVFDDGSRLSMTRWKRIVTWHPKGGGSGCQLGSGSEGVHVDRIAVGGETYELRWLGGAPPSRWPFAVGALGTLLGIVAFALFVPRPASPTFVTKTFVEGDQICAAAGTNHLGPKHAAIACRAIPPAPVIRTPAPTPNWQRFAYRTPACRMGPAEPRPEPEGPPPTPSRADLAQALRSVNGQVSVCSPEPALAQARILFVSSGEVENVSVTGVSTEVATCMRRALRQLTIPPFQRAEFSVNYPYRVGTQR